MTEPIVADIAVIGGGPGGYAAAFHAADAGKRVALIDCERQLGGVCLRAGCIPSKALLHAAAVVREAEESRARGISFTRPSIDLGQLRQWKDGVISRLADGLSGLAAKRRVMMVTGRARFADPHTLRVEATDGGCEVRSDQVIIATGSRPVVPPAFARASRRVMTSTEALELGEIPGTLLIIGGGYIGLELGTVYATLGSRVVLAEATGSILIGTDADLGRLVLRSAQRLFQEVRVQATVTALEERDGGVSVTMEVDGQRREERYDAVLVAVGRAPNTQDLGLEQTRVRMDAQGYIQVDSRQRTADPSVAAIGDVVGGPLLAHKAAKEAKIAADAILRRPRGAERIVMPAVVFTDPELAWCGLTETQARQEGRRVRVARFPWSASGRAMSIDKPTGMTKLIIDEQTERVLGVAIVGSGAGEMISEGVVAMELGATARDLAESVHPHPTLSETIKECAELFYGHALHAFSRSPV